MNRSITIFFILLLQMFGILIPVQAKENPITTQIGMEYEFASQKLKENRKYQVRLPKSYKNSSKNYPVIYLLDGNSHFTHTTSALEVLVNNEKVPEVILVGIPNNPGTRFRDLSQNAEHFLDFIENELMPLIDKKYRTLPHSTLFGHSLAGFFTLNAMANNHHKFANFISASPHLLANKDEVEKKLSVLFKSEHPLPYNLYFSMADTIGDGAERVRGINKFVELLSAAPTTLNWQYQPMAGQDHMTTPYLTIFKGLTFAFKDYQMPRFLNYAEFIKNGDVKAIKSFYQKRADKYGVSAEISEYFFGVLAEVLVGENKLNEALKLLKNNLKENPKSMRAHFDLARLYQQNGDKKLAIKSYQSAQHLLTKNQQGFADYMESQIEALKK